MPHTKYVLADSFRHLLSYTTIVKSRGYRNKCGMTGRLFFCLEPLIKLIDVIFTDFGVCNIAYNLPVIASICVANAWQSLCLCNVVNDKGLPRILRMLAMTGSLYYLFCRDTACRVPTLSVKITQISLISGSRQKNITTYLSWRIYSAISSW